MGILQSCTPRPDLLGQNLNLEIFTASLGSVLKHYRGEDVDTLPLYTDGHKFFSEGTYPTNGLRSVLQAVVSRLGGDASAPSFIRLDTAFGGGKTHTLIACAHAAKMGSSLAAELSAVLPPETVARLPKPGSVDVIGVPCEQLDLYTQGTDAQPYRLWGEFARQIGGEALYRELGPVVTSRGAPGTQYFNKLFDGRRVLILLDEIAQYAARLEADQAGGSANLAAFLLALDDYARNHSGLVTVMTLASSRDAFASQTDIIRKRLKDLDHPSLSQLDPDTLADRADRNIQSVTARSATNTTPVQAGEISAVLARRLFTRIDESAARETAARYMDLYQHNKGALPQKATQADYEARMVQSYPFHPSFIDFLNQKLSASTSFQGTRGVLRMLSLCVHSLWAQGRDRAMIHSCDLDLADAATVDELFGKTGAGELRPALATDVCPLKNDHAPASKADELDAEYRHPNGEPVCRQTWQSVFLNSLVNPGGKEGGSNLFGASAADIALEVSRPGVSPAFVENALKAIHDHAFYLQQRDNRYFASTEVTLAKVLSEIRAKITDDEADARLSSDAAKLIRANDCFNVVANVADPCNVEDRMDKPTLVMVALNAGVINPADYFTSAGAGPRLNQNSLLLLVPDTVEISQDMAVQFSTDAQRQQAIYDLREMARTALSYDQLKRDPLQYNVKRERLDGDFENDRSERGLALQTSLGKTYSTLLIPAAGAQCCDEASIAVAGGEGGTDFLAKIRETLMNRGKYLDLDDASGHLSDVAALLFPGDSEKTDHITVAAARQNFFRDRSWPIPASKATVDSVLREGIRQANWNVFFLDPGESSPLEEQLFGRGRPLPFEFIIQDDWTLLSNNGRQRRGWPRDPSGFDQDSVKKLVEKSIIESKAPLRLSDISKDLKQRYPQTDDSKINETIGLALWEAHIPDDFNAYTGTAEQTSRPELIPVTDVTVTSGSDIVLISNAEAGNRGWKSAAGRQSIHLDTEQDPTVAGWLPQLLRRLGHLKGTASTISMLNLTIPLVDSDRDPNLPVPQTGSRVEFSFSDLDPQAQKKSADLLEAIADLVGSGTTATLKIDDPGKDCALVNEIRALQGDGAEKENL